MCGEELRGRRCSYRWCIRPVRHKPTSMATVQFEILQTETPDFEGRAFQQTEKG